jgi:8-oxo-dGTP pyrophosphatase MutT (NUDIX family)
MRYLDYDKHDQIVRKYFGDDSSARAVGTNRAHDSGYIDIVRFFGCTPLDPGRITINYDPTPFQFSDPHIAQYAAEIERAMRAEGRLYDGPPVMELKSADFGSTAPSITVQPATYGQQAGSCFVLDLMHTLFENRGGTLRAYWKNHYEKTSVESNPLAICLGVCGFLIARESTKPPRILCQHRAGQLASLESSIGPSVAGSVDWVEGYRTLADLIQDAMAREITEELGLKPEEYTITPLAYAREIFRGEKPQIFCSIETALSEQELSVRLSNLPAAHPEHDSFEFIPAPIPGTVTPASLNHEARMNYYLLEEMMAGS